MSELIKFKKVFRSIKREVPTHKEISDISRENAFDLLCRLHFIQHAVKLTLEHFPYEYLENSDRKLYEKPTPTEQTE